MAAPELTIQIASKMAAVVIHKKERAPTSVTAPLVVGQCKIARTIFCRADESPVNRACLSTACEKVVVGPNDGCRIAIDAVLPKKWLERRL